ncbi:type III secretion system inner rod subunit SctI [Ralstonia mojiangensis]|uniref:type III secretion system inner rod subunit SctI n=1 Tax=Ralstonia mojiangensis TaxID=2953895 RepID=UPI002091A141|nr:type III secretion system inner rod subunit SctI [Ralstonia mojiangensis]MCO5413467.1 type III secretion system inner rod subunit SctI [Ralstonia mojiangensis]
MALTAVSDAKAGAGRQSLDGRMQSEFVKLPKVDSVDDSPEGRMLNAFAQYSEVASSRLDRIGEVGRGGSDDPMRLLKVQAELTNFHIEMSLSSALARKGVAVVETLVKA